MPFHVDFSFKDKDSIGYMTLVFSMQIFDGSCLDRAGDWRKWIAQHWQCAAGDWAAAEGSPEGVATGLFPDLAKPLMPSS